MPPSSKLTPIVEQAIVAAIENGMYKETAAEIAGISPRSLYSWLARGRQEAENAPTEVDPDDYTKKELQALCDERGIGYALSNTKAELADTLNDPDNQDGSPYLRLFQAVKRAQAKAIAYALQEMMRAGRDDWRMWMTYLERTHPDMYARRNPEDAYDPAYQAGDADDADRILARVEQIKVKMLERPSDDRKTG